MFGNLGFGEIIGILVICLLLFGSKRLPEIGASFGKGIREFKRSLTDAGDAISGGGNSGDAGSTPPSRQIDQRSGPNPPTGGEPKRLSQ
jgi:sec-independent protein translocase protein TatA